MTTPPRLIQTFLLDGTLEGVKIIELSEGTIKAFVIPRLKLADIKNRHELQWPSLYFLISADESLVYIGESENFYDRVRNHDQNKDFWDIAVAIVSTDNKLEKGDVKYLESLAVERAQGGSIEVLNKTVPTRNNIHEFKLHSLEHILDDTQLIIASQGYDVLSRKEASEQVWYCKTKQTDARAVFRGDKFILLSGSVIDRSAAPSWIKAWPKAHAEREQILKQSGTPSGDTVTLTENVATRSPNHAGLIVAGRSTNAWTTWHDALGRTMDEVMRKGEK